MKNTITISFFILLSLNIKAQEAMWWGSRTVNEVVDKSDLIFEGRVLMDSPYFQSNPGHIYTSHRVLVLKQFKGNFQSDTITVITNGGNMILDKQWEGRPDYTHKGDEAVFLATSSQKVYIGGDPNTFWTFYGPGVSYVTPCNKKDPIKEVYEPLEKVIGHPYIELRPNTCKEQQERAAKEKPRHVPKPINLPKN